MFFDYHSYLIYILISIIFDLILLINSFSVSKFLGILDQPTIRKNHNKPTPLIFGLVGLKNILIFLFFSSFSVYSILLSILLLLIFILGFYDDLKNINYITNLFFTSVIALFTLEFFPSLTLDKVDIYIYKQFSIDKIGIFLTLLCILFLLNISNWFDGFNTFSSIHMMSIFIFFIFKFDFNDQSYFLIVITVSSLLIFLYFNYSGKCFMGSSGIYLLAFLVGYLFLKLNSYGDIYFEQIISLCLIQIIDFFKVITIRLRFNKSIFLPDNKNHYHHIMKLLPYNYKVLIVLLHSSLGLIGAIYLDYVIFLCILNLSIYLFNHLYSFKIFNK